MVKWLGPIERTVYPSGDTNPSWPFTIDLERFWREDGAAFNEGNGELTHPDKEIVSEFLEQDSPVRTVTRKEIVSGEYEDVRVTTHANGVGIGIDTIMNASQLRAAASILIQLAEALEE